MKIPYIDGEEVFSENEDSNSCHCILYADEAVRVSRDDLISAVIERACSVLGWSGAELSYVMPAGSIMHGHMLVIFLDRVRDGDGMIIVLCGVCGAGKSHTYREKYSHLPLVDISDIYEETGNMSWNMATREVARRAAGIDGGCVIEGLFLEGTLSRILLDRELAERGRHNVVYELVHAPYDVCAQRIENDAEDNTDIRLKILNKRWHRADEQFKENK